MDGSRMSSESSSGSDDFKKCRICHHPSHGVHFGVLSCRACAAFFRRAHISVTSDFRKCRNSDGKCTPCKNGRWFCKKCRFNKCLELGMNESNIQYDRDSLKAIVGPSENRSLVKSFRTKVTLKCELIAFIEQVGKNNNLPHIDTSRLVQKAITGVLTPNLVLTRRKLNSLESLTQGLIELRSDQKESLSEIQFISVDDYKNEFERNMCATAKWLGCSEWIRKFDDELKIVLLRSIWWIWGRLEQIAITAKMRIREKCGNNQFVYSPDSILDYEKMVPDLSCWSIYSFEQMKFFFMPTETFYDDVVLEMMKIQPDDVELTFLMCNLCFQLAGDFYGGRIQDEMERLQDVLSNDLHKYHLENNQPMYLLRLKHLMKIQETFLKLRKIRLEKYEIAGVFNMLNRSFSNPEFFCCSP